MYFFFSIRKAFYSDKELDKKYYAFSRNDHEQISLIKSFPFWLTLWPRVAVILGLIVFYTIYIQIVMIGYKQGEKLGTVRRELVKRVGQFWLRPWLLMVGIAHIKKKKPEIDYSNYLGKDW